MGVERDERGFFALVELRLAGFALLRGLREAGDVLRLRLRETRGRYAAKRRGGKRKDERGEVVRVGGVRRELEPLAVDGEVGERKNLGELNRLLRGNLQERDGMAIRAERGFPRSNSLEQCPPCRCGRYRT